MNNRCVLVIAYYFPPSGGSGVQRSLKFVKYLPAYGWKPLVVTVDPEFAAYPNLDSGMLDEVPAEAEVHRTRSWDPYQLYAGLTGQSKDDAVSVGFLSDKPITLRERFARWVRANVFVPDARVGWNRYALAKARELIKNGKVDAIFTTGPPHSTHLVGRRLHREFGLPWIADFRDPWSDIDYLEELPMSGLVSRLNQNMEQSVLDEASAVLTISPAMQRKYATKTKTHCQTIFNGFDATDFERNASADPAPNFVISHVGNMNAARNPVALWKVLASTIETMPKLKIRLVGNADGEVWQSIKQHKLEDRVEHIPYCPHAEAVQEMAESQVLLLPINRVFSAKGIVTGKLFEYLATQNPVLGIGPVDGDAAAILNETQTGQMFDFDDAGGIQTYLQTLYQQWSANQPLPSPAADAILPYSRRGQTGQLAALLDNLVDRSCP